MSCFWGFCNNRCNCNNNCGGNWNNNCGCNNNGVEDDFEEEKRRAFWAGVRDGCKSPWCKRINENDNCDR